MSKGVLVVPVSASALSPVDVGAAADSPADGVVVDPRPAGASASACPVPVVVGVDDVLEGPASTAGGTPPLLVADVVVGPDTAVVVGVVGPAMARVVGVLSREIVVAGPDDPLPVSVVSVSSMMSLSSVVGGEPLGPLTVVSAPPDATLVVGPGTLQPLSKIA